MTNAEDLKALIEARGPQPTKSVLEYCEQEIVNCDRIISEVMEEKRSVRRRKDKGYTKALERLESRHHAALGRKVALNDVRNIFVTRKATGLKLWIVTEFTGLWPVGTAAVVSARDREHCKRVLLEHLRSDSSSLQRVPQSPDHWTIEPLPDTDELTQFAHVILDGNY